MCSENLHDHIAHKRSSAGGYGYGQEGFSKEGEDDGGQAADGGGQGVSGGGKDIGDGHGGQDCVGEIIKETFYEAGFDLASEKHKGNGAD